LVHSMTTTSLNGSYLIVTCFSFSMVFRCSVLLAYLLGSLVLIKFLQRFAGKS
jgi:hypothetical protein